MKIAAVIPSRYGSTRFEGKSLALIAGKSVIQRVYENAVRSARLGLVVVATDDQRIRDAVCAFGGQVIMTSPENRSGTDRVAEAVEQLGLGLDDIVLNVQGDQPLVNPLSFDAVVEPLIHDPQIDMSTLAYRITDPDEYPNPAHCKVVMDRQGYALYFSRACIPYVRDSGDTLCAYKHLGVYAYSRRFLELFRRLPSGSLEQMEKLEQLRALENGYRVKVIITPYDSPEVDLPEDITRIEKRMSQNGNTDAPS